MAAKKYTLAKDFGEWKAGDSITKTEAGDQFEAMEAEGVFETEQAPAEVEAVKEAPKPQYVTKVGKNGTITATVE